jgi:serine/threonine-protein kinase
MRATALGVIMGTAAYMAPEQAKGKPVDKRADIWAFGVVMMEMLTGRPLYTGETVAETLAAVIRDQPDIERLPAGTPAALLPLARRCLDKDPQERLRDIGEARIAINEALAGGAAEEAAPVARARIRALPWAVAAVLALALIGLGVEHWRARRPAERSLLRLSVDLGPDAVLGERKWAAISPDGTRLAFVAQDAGGKELLATRPLDQPKAVLLAGTEGAYDPFFSPDGEWIGFFAGGRMKKIPAQGGSVVILCEGPSARGASWGVDGSIIVTLTTSGGGLSRVPSTGGTPEALTKPGEKGETTHRWPQVLPGGQAVIFTGNSVLAGYEDASIEALSLRTGQWKVVQRGGYFGRYLPSGHLVYMHQGTLFAVPFDVDRLEVRGTPAPVLEDMAGTASIGNGRFDFARNGTFVYLSGKSAQAWPVVWLDSAGKTEPLLAAGQYSWPRFSPDGKRLALVSGFNIEVYDWARAAKTQLTFTGQANRAPVWTPDGKRIAFGEDSPAGSRLQWIRSDGAGVARPLLESKGNLRPHSFSPDGRRLAFYEVAGETDWDIWTLPLDTSDPEHPKPGKPELFLRTPASEMEPAFSPDGRWMAYRSNESGRYEVYVRPFPQGAGGKWQISAGGGISPIWSRNARELFYETLDDRIMVAAYIATGGSFAADKPRVWSDTRLLHPEGTLVPSNLDLGPDGKRFVVFARTESQDEQKGSVHVTFLLNFFDYLRRRVP